MEEINEMLKLGEAFLIEGIKRLKKYKIERPNFIYNRHKMIIAKRFAVVEFVNGLELILKAILIKKGYSINLLKKGLFKKNAPKSDLISEKTLDLESIINFFRKNYPELHFNDIHELRKIRNQIIHKGTEIETKKRQYFISTIECINCVYNRESIKHKKFLEKISDAKEQI